MERRGAERFVGENYNSTAYQTLIRLGTMGAIKLKITDITLQEIRQQIAEKVDAATKSMQAKAGKSAIFSNFDGYRELMAKFSAQKSESLAAELFARVESELTDAGVEIIKATEMRSLRKDRSLRQIGPTDRGESPVSGGLRWSPRAPACARFRGHLR